MNQKIQEIWNKAASSHTQASTSWETQRNFLTRFAQLIAEECAKIADKTETNRTSDLIRKQFDLNT